MAGWIEVLSQALIHLNDQPVGPFAPQARLRTLTEAPKTVKVWKTKDQATVPMLATDLPYRP